MQEKRGLKQQLHRHGRAWPDHPRISMGKAAKPPANSWVLVLSTRMTEFGDLTFGMTLQG
jgi:hypothetical protein